MNDTLSRTMFCKYCGALISDSATTCSNCGSELTGNNTPSPAPSDAVRQSAPTLDPNMKYCQHCAQPIPKAAVVCTHCGCQVEQIQQQAQATPNIVIQNSNMNTNTNINQNAVAGGKMKNKWVSIALCLLLGWFGGHKFYEEKTGAGILYLFTGGLCGIGVMIDLITLLFKPNPYYV